MRVRYVAVWMLAGVSLTAQEAVGPSANGADLYSLEKEAALGKQLAADFRQRTTPIDSPTVQDYLHRLGQRIAAQVPDAKYSFTFSVIADDPCRAIHEPAALPGGYLFVPAALFVAAQDEAEFASMLAHAMEHIAQRHGVRQATRGQLVNYPSIPLIFIGGWARGCSEGQAIPRALLASQRSNELQADALAVQTMARAGFDLVALVRYIERVRRQPNAGVPEFSAALPDRDQRAARMRLLIENMQPSIYAAPGVEFTAIQREVRRLVERRAPVDAPPTLRRNEPK
jgi:beta-barrel assembly-enhancing protease